MAAKPALLSEKRRDRMPSSSRTEAGAAQAEMVGRKPRACRMTVREGETKARSWFDSWRPHRPNIDPAVQEELNHYTTDHLSRLYHEETRGYIRLRNFILSYKELDAELQRRRWLESIRFRIIIALLSIAAVASVIAAVEGFRAR
jgi:hypothetical protein